MFSKSIVALITPFDALGRVDYETFERLIFMQLEAGTSGLLILGSTGEGLSLSLEEKQKLIHLTVSAVKGKVPIMVGASSASVNMCLEMLKLIKMHKADAALVTPPFYVCPSQKGICAYFSELDKFGLPIVLYHHPGRTGLTLALDTVQQIASLKCVVGIKESSGSEAFFCELAKSIEAPLFVGDDVAMLTLSPYGAVGSISVVANAFPKRWLSYVEICLAGKKDEAAHEHTSFMPLFKALSLESNPVGIKYVMHRLGLSELYTRLPLLPSEEESMQVLNEALNKVTLNRVC